mmetsp:Transcript_77460/g.215257  ORF Transcript_77460/g.215257 Transcript_77460/m.215257 type:complete len:306 (-) Transcript_77460:200-1117(-)
MAQRLQRRSSGRALLFALALFGAYHFGGLPSASVAVTDDAKAEPASFVSNHTGLATALVFVLCLLVAKMERQVAPPAAVPLEKRGDYGSVLFMNSLLSLTSGMINALAFLELGATIAHHSGNLTHWGRSWGSDGFRFGCYLAMYLCGGAMVGYIKSDCEAIFVGRFSPSMVSSVIAVVGGTIIHMLTGNALMSLMLWSFSQGIQNCLCRKFSSMPLCSTHFTGYLSDAGAALGAWTKATLSGEAPPPMKKAGLFIACMLSFAVGGFIAKLARDSYGIVVAFAPALLMAAAAAGVFPMSGAQGKTA